MPKSNPKSSNPSKSAKKTARPFEFSNRSKIFWPEKKYTKGNLIDYYQQVGPVMMKYLKDHPCNLLRQPNGYKGKSFFQKDTAGHLPDWVTTVSVYSESDQKNLSYYVCDDLDALLYMAQLGCIEINPWSSRVGSLDKPDWGVIDLDPEGVDFKQVVTVANAVHDICSQLKLPHFPKTSGKTGLHIFMPMQAKYSYRQVRQFCQIIATLVHEQTKDITSLERDPKKRRRKIYLDYLQNRQTQTLAAPYSARPTKDASVSMPLDWDEVNQVLDPADFTIKNMPERLKKLGDLWQPVNGKAIDLNSAIAKLEKLS